MKLAFAFLAEAATVVPDKGWFSVLNGGIDTVGGPRFPGPLHGISLIVRVAFSEEDCGRDYECHVGLFGPDGAILPPEFRPTLKPKRPADRNSLEYHITLCLAFQNVQLSTAGDYSFRISVDGQVLGQVGLRVRHLEGA
jgi:hypothetical protein